jgi:pimeloyl-ACP methyl ester carboxylesterase
VDLPGFGESPPLDAEPTITRLTEAVEETITSLGLSPCHIAGNSLGGVLALELARAGAARSVVAIAPLGFGTERENRRTRRRLRTARVGARLVAPFAGAVAAAAWGRTVLGALQASRPWRTDAEDTAYTVRAFARSSSFDAVLRHGLAYRARGLEEISSCPLRIVWGTRDRVLPFRQSLRFAELLGEEVVRPLRGLGHIPMSDDPGLLAETIFELTTTSGRGSAEERLRPDQGARR